MPEFNNSASTQLVAQAPTTTDASAAELVQKLSQSYLDSNLDKVSKGLQAVGVEEYLEQQGLSQYTKGASKEGFKNLLAAGMIFYLMYKAKQHWKPVLGGVAVLAIIIIATKKKKEDQASSQPVIQKSTVMGIRG